MTHAVRLAMRLYHFAVSYSFLFYALALLAAPASTGAQAPWTGPGVGIAPVAETGSAARAVLHVGVTVADMDRSLDFYTRVLSFTVEADTEVVGPEWERVTGVFGVRLRIARLRLGSERLELTEYLAATTPGRPVPVDSRSNDRWFQHVAIITSDMDSAYRLLRAHRVRHASTGPQRLPRTLPNAAGIRAFYFRDPDGHALEVLQFPPDKGDPKWQRKDRLFLGIDHTAIVVEDTERSLRFYRDLLGLTVAGGSENFGTEQEHLNNVEGAHLRITALRAPIGPGVEFLEYLRPRDGRPYPADARPNDLLHWHTVVAVGDLGTVLAGLGGRGATLVSRPGRNSVAGLGVLIRDPDGHAVLLQAP
jgi:catechol 2,3-dioxygenase-like lactoylglutathione lyase family enzyme